MKETVFDLQINPGAPGLQFHRIDKSKDPNFWSMRVNRDVRLIIHKTQDSFLICYVAHHDDAYLWAERRRIEAHPKTGAAQIVEVRERVHEIIVHKTIEAERPAAPIRVLLPPLFPSITDEELLSYGVPVDWLADVKTATEDTLFDIAEHLPREAAEALLRPSRWRKAADTGCHRTRNRQPLRASRRPAALPRHGGCRRTQACAGISVGSMDSVPASVAAASGGAVVQRPRAGVRLGRNGQDRGCPASRHERPAPASAGAVVAYDVFIATGQCARRQASYPHRRGQRNRAPRDRPAVQGRGE